ncbi:MAG: hypothetical protein ACC618_02880 [Patescibacteria group bacterium]
MTIKLPKIVIIIFLASIFVPKNALSQTDSSGIAISFPIQGDVESGHIVCTRPEGFRLCDTDFDPQMFGVITDNPAAALLAAGTEGDVTRLVLSSGMAKVKVSGVNGSISEGDFVTASEIPGVGQLANRNGYVLGASLNDFGGETKEDRGEILVALKIHPAAGLAGPRSDLINVIRQGVSAPLFEPLAAFRYLLAAFMILIAFSLGFIYFGRVAKTGIEAIGRNPMASKVIQLSVVINIVMTVIIVLIGLAIAYLILIL